MGTKNLDFDVVVVGGGFGGVYCAQALERTLGRRSPIRVALISEENYMVFQPMLAEVAGASISPRHVVNPLRLLCRRADILKGRVESIDWKSRTLTLDAGSFCGQVAVRYQHLVVALGAVVDLRRIPGMPEHAFLMQNVGDAMLLRTTLLSRFEEANIEQRPEIKQRLLTFVVVGGGYSGVETAGQIVDLFRGICRYYHSVSESDVRVVLVHSGERVLEMLEPRLSAYCARIMQSRGLEFRLNSRVRAVTATQVLLEGGERIPAATVVSTVGNAPHPLVLELIAQNNLPQERGRIVVEADCRVAGHDNLWAVGDCAIVPKPGGGAAPQTAQFAYQEGRQAGRNIAAVLADGRTKPFSYRGLGELATIGHRAAVASIMGFNFSGFIAWWMWRTIYLQKLPRFDRKVRVAIDWTLDLFFPRDINQLSPRFSQLLKEIYLESGDTLFHAGEPAFSLYVVREGSIELSDEQTVVSTHQPGDYFGERALLGDGRWRFTARAATPTHLVSIPRQVFRQMVGSGGSLGRLFRRSASRYQSREVIDAIAQRLPNSVLDQPVSALMSTELISMEATQSVADAMPLIRDQPHSSYPVVDAQGRFQGLLRREDYQDFLKSENTTTDSNLTEIGLVTVPTVHESVSVREALERLIRSGKNKIVVLNADNRLRGVVTMMDLAATAERMAASGGQR